ncbi:MAG: hypothetical protein CMG16_00175 [Candidatus Marinimicrobia bacterium]|nr:hypothetical protein [Candidatus Neomarinimicrobiota bacterium]
MKISFKNIKSFDKDTSLKLKKLNVIIGPNSSGKSTLNQAIRYFSNLGKYNNELVDGKSTNFSMICSFGKYYDKPPKYLYKIINGHKEYFKTHFDLKSWVHFKSPLSLNIQDEYLSSETRDLDFNHQKGIRTTIDMKLNSVPSALEDNLNFFDDFEVEYKNFINPKGEKLPYLSNDKIDFNKVLSKKDELKNIEKYSDVYESYKIMTSKSPIMVPKDLIDDKVIIGTINKFSKKVYNYALQPIQDKEMNSLQTRGTLLSVHNDWTRRFVRTDSDPIGKNDNNKYHGTVHQVFNDAMRGYMYSSNYKFLDGYTMYSSLEDEIKTDKRTVLTFNNKSLIQKLLKNTIMNLSDSIFNSALSNINDIVKKTDWPDEWLKESLSETRSNFTRLILTNPSDNMFLSSKFNKFIESKKLNEDIDHNNKRIFLRLSEKSKELDFSNHFDTKTFTDSFYPAHSYEKYVKETGVFHDYDMSLGEPELTLNVRNFGLHSFFFDSHYMRANQLNIKSNIHSPSYYKEFSIDETFGNFFHSSSFDLNITNHLELEGVINDDVDSVLKFLKEIGHYKLWRKAFKVVNLKSGKNKYSFISLNSKSKVFKSSDIIKLKKKFEKILKLTGDKSSLFSNGLLLSILSSTVQTSIDNLVEEGILANPKFILEKYHKNIKKMAKKYRVSQKSIIKEMMILDKYLLNRIITWYQSLAYDLFMLDYLQLSDTVSMQYNNRIYQVYNIKPKLLDIKNIFKNDNVSEKHLLNFFGNDFQSLIDADYPFFEDSRKNRGLLRFQKFINSSLKNMKIDYTFKIYPIMSKKIDNKIPSENTGLFKLKLENNERIIDLAESGSGDMAIISILGQLFFVNEWWIDRNNKVNVVNNSNESSSITTSSGKMISLHEPENHLHPKIISKFAEFLFNYTLETGIRTHNKHKYEEFKNHSGLIVETHSEIFIRKFQSLTRKMKNKFSENNGKEEESLVNIFYVNKDKNGSSSVTNLGLQSDGFLSKKIPPGFFDINTNLISDLWKPSKKDKL